MASVFALCGGYLELARESTIRDAPPSRWTVPIECFLVAHPRGRLLFGTGLHCETMTNMPGHTARSGRGASVCVAGPATTSSASSAGSVFHRPM